MRQLPQIVHVDGRPRLLVDGRPFLILGLQWDCDSCFSAEEMNPLLPHAVRLGANTAVLPTYWREVEPEPDQFDFRMVDERIFRSQENGLRAILLWFATWKNTCPFYTADYIRSDPDIYPMALDRDGNRLFSLCPLSESTWRRDRNALVALMEHIKAVDDANTVIMVQIENEAGIQGSDRCYCPACNEQFAAGDWEAEWGDCAGDAFTIATVSKYIDRLAKEAKAVYPIPMYVNNYIHLGPIRREISRAVELTCQNFQHVDMYAPDIYGANYQGFDRLCRAYSADDNPFYVAEHSSSPAGRAERNVFYALGRYGAIGFDPWAIDSPFPERDVPPLVDPAGGEWGPQAYWLRDSYFAIGRAMQPIIEAQGTDRLFTFVQEEGEEQTEWKTPDCHLLISYHDRDGASRGMIIQQTPNEFLLLGIGFSVRFRHTKTPDKPVSVVSAEWGRCDGDQWILLHPMRRERPESAGHPVTVREPGVARIVLARDEETV